mgnify:CR=1 FL=1
MYIYHHRVVRAQLPSLVGALGLQVDSRMSTMISSPFFVFTFVFMFELLLCFFFSFFLPPKMNTSEHGERHLKQGWS